MQKKTLATRHVVRRSLRFLSLQWLARGLNQLRHGKMEQKKDRHAWENVERVVIGVTRETIPRKERSILSNMMAGAYSRPSLQTARDSFDWLAKNYPVRLTVNLKTAKNGVLVPLTGITAHSPSAGLEAAHLHILWEHFFGKRGYERFKTCQVCGDWFLDFGRNKRKIYCSRTCTDRAWPRSRRREANRAARLKEIERKIADYRTHTTIKR